jgi:2-methylaconitate cis-trans-isomerase PrpF
VDNGRVAVRAISVPSWHPTLALTGAACLGTAASIAGTVPWLAVKQAGITPGGLIDIVTPGGSTSVRATTHISDGVHSIAWLSISHTQVSFNGSFFIEPLAHFQFKEVGECLSPSA